MTPIKTGGIVAATFAVIAATTFFTYANLNSQQNANFQQLEAQKKNMRVTYDNMFKVIAQTAEVSDKYAKDFSSIFPRIMEGRYGNARGGALMSWIQERNPNFDTTLYVRLTDQIESQRAQFLVQQRAAIDIQQEYETRRTNPMTKWAVGGWAPSSLRLVTSARTDTAFESGREDDVKLFGH